jgi:hypothetical protein
MAGRFTLTKIFQTSPRLVFSIEDKVYKFFNCNHDCSSEVKSIRSSLLQSNFDAVSGYTMKIVEIIQSFDNYYIMKVAKGAQLSTLQSKKYCNLAGCWLRVFHKSSYNTQSKSIFIFGDFSITHLYIDDKYKEITAIDPGAGFGKVGEIEDDISRFLVSLMQTKNFNIIKLNKNVTGFLGGYGVDKIKYSNLDKSVKFRISRNYEKRITLDTGLKRFFSAYFWLANSTIKYYFINKNLKKEIKNEY